MRVYAVRTVHSFTFVTSLWERTVPEERAKAKQAIDFLEALMTRVVLALFILKEG
jgi:hypothetical protein